MIFLIEESSNVFSKKGRNLEILQFSFNFLDTRSFIDSCRVSPHQSLSQSRLLTSRKISVNFSSRCGPSWPPDLEFTSTRKVTLNSDMTPRVTTPRVTCYVYHRSECLTTITAPASGVLQAPPGGLGWCGGPQLSPLSLR